MKKTKFKVILPADLFDNDEKYSYLMKDYAIYTAKEEATDYIIPANWSCGRPRKVGSDLHFTVTRETNV